MTTDPNALAQIETIRATLAVSGTIPEQMLAQIGEQLGQLWQTAEAAQDNVSLQAISATWALAQEQAATTKAVAEAAISAADLASTLMKARDQIAEEYADLTAAVETGDRRNYLVDDLIGEIEESVSEQVFDQAMDYAYDTMHDELVEQIRESTKADYRTVSQFYSALRNGDMTPDEMDALLALMDLINLRINAEFERRMRAS
jgi:multidrug efflux pump subunit AcrA (membrane-fusion protein)